MFLKRRRQQRTGDHQKLSNSLFSISLTHHCRFGEKRRHASCVGSREPGEAHADHPGVEYCRHDALQHQTDDGGGTGGLDRAVSVS